MAKFRLLLLLFTVWLTLIFNLSRPELLLGEKNLSLDLSPTVYIIAAVSSILILLLPDLSRTRLVFVFVPVLAIYLVARFGLTSPDPSMPKHTAYFVVTEVVVLFLTVVIVRIVSLSVTKFEQAVDSVVLKTANSNILTMADGEERINAELVRARRFDRPAGFIVVKISSLDEAISGRTHKLSLGQAFESHYARSQIGQIVETAFHKSDIFAWYNNDLVVCIPETTLDGTRELARELNSLLDMRLGVKVPLGIAAFPASGLIYQDLLRTALQNIQPFSEPSSGNQNPPPSNGNGANGNNVHGKVPVEVADAPETSLIHRLIGRMIALRKAYWSLADVVPIAPPKARRANGNNSKDPDFWVNKLPYQSASTRAFYRAVKRGLDVFIVVASLPVTLPLSLLVALLVFLDSGRPIFFLQDRTGLGGKRFKMHKFRTMVPNAEAMLRDLASQGLAKLNADGKLAEPLKMEKDPRVTRLGQFLRKTSLDELPQLIDVLNGNMSLVGPRPTSWGLDSYNLLQTTRLTVRPGITGLWQVYSRGTTDFNNWVQWDILYIDKMSLSLDAQILWQTVGKVLSRRGAH